MVITVGIGEYAASCNTGDTIVTYALASCVAVTAYSPSKKAAGMVHIVLPAPATSRVDDFRPYYYAITGVPLMISKLCSEYGCLKSELIIRLFGGADSMNRDDVFKLGQKNIRTIEGILRDMGLSYDSTETGGGLSRTLELGVATGTVDIKVQPITI